MVVLPAGPAMTWHSNANRVRGMTVVSNWNDFPGTTAVSCTARVPCLVFIVPVVPAANGPLSTIAWTSGFHSCHLDVSVQMFQTACGLAAVSTDRSLVANRSSSDPERCGARPREKKIHHAGDQEADEVAEVGPAEPGGKRSLRSQAEDLELL